MKGKVFNSILLVILAVGISFIGIRIVNAETNPIIGGNKKDIKYTLEEQNIFATFSSITPEVAKLGETIEIEYEINPKDFVFNKSSNENEDKDVVFLIDVSKDMANNNRWLNIRNGLDNQFVTRFTQNGKQNVRYNIITYSKDAKSVYNDDFKYEQGVLHNTLLAINTEQNSERNIGKALSLAKGILEGNNANLGASKNIVMISSGEVNAEGIDVNEVRNSGINIISIELQGDSGKNIESFKKLHNSLGGKNTSYISWKSDGGNYNGGDDIMKGAANELSSMRKNIYYITDAKLKFNLGNDLEGVSGFTERNNNEITIKLGNIKYQYDERKDKYVSSFFKVKFNIKGTKYGDLRFGENNYLSYCDLSGREIKKDIYDTPIVKIIAPISQLKYGLYEGINNGKVSIDTTLNREFAVTSNVNFAASFKMSGSAIVKLQLDPNGQIEENPRIFKVEGNMLEPINDVVLTKDNIGLCQWEINGIDKETQILILYGYKINDEVNNSTITNTIDVSGKSAEVKINVKKDGKDIPLPDLF